MNCCRVFLFISKSINIIHLLFDKEKHFTHQYVFFDISWINQYIEVSLLPLCNWNDTYFQTIFTAHEFMLTLVEHPPYKSMWMSCDYRNNSMIRINLNLWFQLQPALLSELRYQVRDENSTDLWNKLFNKWYHIIRTMVYQEIPFFLDEVLGVIIGMSIKQL